MAAKHISVHDDMHLTGDCRLWMAQLIDNRHKVQTCITSPPYFRLSDYQIEGQIGLETSLNEYIAALVGVFRQVRELLHNDGTLWLNLGDSYSDNGKGLVDVDAHGQTRTLRGRNLMGIPWRVALALQDDGWFLRQDIIWHKTNAMPESVTDRCVRAHEYLFLLSKKPKYYFDHLAIQEPSAIFERPSADKAADFVRPENRRGQSLPQGVPQHRLNRDHVEVQPMRNKRSVWAIATTQNKSNHPAAFPAELVRNCLLAATRPGDWVLDPFGGSGTVAAVANQYGRRWISIEIDPQYAETHLDRTIQRSFAV